MAHNLGKLADGRTSFAFRGDRSDIWHCKGNQFDPSWSLDDWARNSGLDFTAVKLPAFADPAEIRNPREFGPTMLRVPDRHFIVRTDNLHVLSPSTVSNLYQIVQPRAVLEWFQQYVAVDDRFVLDVAGALHGGETIWASAVYNGDMTVASERHKARLLMTTTFDGTGATINRGCVTRVVCNNTLNAAMAEIAPTVRTRHNTHFDAARVGRELAVVVASFAAFKAMGDAMAAVHFSEKQVADFFKRCLEIPDDAEWSAISARKRSQFEELVSCYQVGTRQEGLRPATGWSMIQAVSRYADHNRSVRGADGTPTGIADMRFASSVIDDTGSGAQLKARSVRYVDELMSGALRAAAQHALAVAMPD